MGDIIEFIIGVIVLLSGAVWIIAVPPYVIYTVLKKYRIVTKDEYDRLHGRKHG